MTSEINISSTSNGNQPLMSVIVPIYNAAEHLSCCLDSLVAQTLEGVEFIFVNDCSTDQSAAILRSRLQDFSSAQFIDCAENGGVSVARNRGLAAAQGRYISWVDADDVALPTYCETLLRLAEDYQADVAQVAYVITHDETLQPAQPQQPAVRVLTGMEALAEMFQEEHYAVWGRIYKRELFAGTGANGSMDLFPVGLTCEDRIGNVALLSRAATVAVSNRVEYLYRENIGSISADGLNRRGFDLLEADAIDVRACRKLGDATVLKLAEDRAAKGAFSLLVKWFRFGTTDLGLNEKEALETLWARFHTDYPRLMASDLPAAKRTVAWQMKHCPGVLRTIFAAHRGLGTLRAQRGVKGIMKQNEISPSKEQS